MVTGSGSRLLFDFKWSFVKVIKGSFNHLKYVHHIGCLPSNINENLILIYMNIYFTLFLKNSCCCLMVYILQISLMGGLIFIKNFNNNYLHISLKHFHKTASLQLKFN